MLNDSLYKRLFIKSVEQAVTNFKIISFEENHNLQYKAGQYITLVRFSYNEEIRRSYSITSSPDLNEPLSIGVKRIDNGYFSRLLVDHAAPGNEVITIGAGGLFVLPDNIDAFKQVFFFAAGSGITPVYALIKTLLFVHQHTNVVLIYSNASEEKTVFLNELKTLEEKFKYRFTIRFLFSNILQLAKARLHRNLIIGFLRELSVGDYGQTLFYICGPQSYMRLCTYTLQEHDVPKNNIKREDFGINVVKRDVSPPDKSSHTVYIKLGDNNIQFGVHYPDSILSAAKKANVVLPYSCETGRCGSCVAKCIKGDVWHSYNEVLTENEIQQGLVLTCVGHAINGDVELEINI
ncbi:flavin reductase family protein [Parafilimonas sp.]|uniref:flavin reductase family protein n=1 Tax=Parafilimonas sp. TaxID=1969739 RepID=UPI003F7FA392